MNAPAEDTSESLWSHIEALRSVLIRCLLVLAAGFILTIWFYQEIFTLITRPLEYTQSEMPHPLQKQALKLERLYNSGREAVNFSAPPNTRIIEHSPAMLTKAGSVLLIPPGGSLTLETTTLANQLAIFGPAEGMITSFKVCFWVSLVLTAPLWLFFCMQFIAPALRSYEKRLILPFFGLSAAFLSAGVLFAYFVTLPLSNAFLWAFNAELGNNLWSLGNYLDYTLFLLLANALAFEISLVLFFLVHLGIITANWMAAHRRYIIVATLILGALLTPPDIPSQLMLTIPLLGLYEIALLYARFIAAKNTRARAHTSG